MIRLSRHTAFLFAMLALSSGAIVLAQDHQQSRPMIDLEKQPNVPSPLGRKLTQALVDEGLLPWIESIDDHCIRILGTKDDDWIYVEESITKIRVEIRQLKSNDLLASRDFSTNRAWCIEIVAKAGNDRVTNNTWQTSDIYGNEGFDFIEGGFKLNTIFGGPDDDLIYSYGGTNISGAVTSVFGEGGNDGILHFWGDSFLSGGPGDDFIQGGNGNDEIRGEEGNDRLIGGDGLLDFVYGGPGDDVLVGGYGTDALFGDDVGIYPNDGKDRLYGQEGQDLLRGGGNDDILVGGPDQDEMYGNDGNDQMYARDGVSDFFVHGGRGVDVYAIDRSPNGPSDPNSRRDGNNILSLASDPPTPVLQFDRSRFQLIFGIR